MLPEAEQPVPVHEAANSLLARAIETDRIYFELGAAVERLPGAVLAWMPGLAASPAAAVVQRVRPDVVACQGVAWIEQVETAFERIGAGLVRIYCDGRDEASDRILQGAGYASRDELVLLAAPAERAVGVRLRPVVSEADWRRKLAFHEQIAESPDGHGNAAGDWVELERRKCGRGMEAFLAEADGEVVGAIGAIWAPDLLRMKNIVVHPRCRRRAIGHAMLHALGSLGRDRGVFEQCVLAVRGEAGEAFYAAAGFRLIGAQVEWSKRIEILQQ